MYYCTVLWYRYSDIMLLYCGNELRPNGSQARVGYSEGRCGGAVCVCVQGWLGLLSVVCCLLDCVEVYM